MKLSTACNSRTYIRAFPSEFKYVFPYVLPVTFVGVKLVFASCIVSMTEVLLGALSLNSAWTSEIIDPDLCRQE